MTHAERFRLLAIAAVGITAAAIASAIRDAPYTGNLFTAAAVFVAGAVIVMPAPRRKRKGDEA